MNVIVWGCEYFVCVKWNCVLLEQRQGKIRNGLIMRFSYRNNVKICNICHVTSK